MEEGVYTEGDGEYAGDYGYRGYDDDYGSWSDTHSQDSEGDVSSQYSEDDDIVGCPSRAVKIGAIACKDKKMYRKNALLLHPDKNRNCTREHENERKEKWDKCEDQYREANK